MGMPPAVVGDLPAPRAGAADGPEAPAQDAGARRRLNPEATETS